MRPEVEIPDLPFYFKSSLRYGLSSLDTLVRDQADVRAAPGAESFLPELRKLAGEGTRALDTVRKLAAEIRSAAQGTVVMVPPPAGDGR